MPKQEAIEFLEGCAYDHQWYIDRPEELAKLPGNNSSIELQRQLVGEYQQVIDLIKEK